MTTTLNTWRCWLAGGFIAMVLASPLSAQELELLPGRIPAPSLDGGGEWLNTAGPIELRDLRGKFVILDFWTYCCINCMHILPELKQLEHEFPKHLVVIGVHSAKFENERDAKNVSEAIERYEIEHPVVNDPRQILWQKYAVDTWPSLRVIDPEGRLVAHHKGEFAAEMVARFLKQAIPSYRRRNLLDETPLSFDATRPPRPDLPLRFPGKVLADADSDRLFVADSGHNRIVITKLSGEVLDIIGTGAIGREDGTFEQCSFDHPQGMALQGETLFVADTENHLLRKVDLKTRRVTTLAGSGEQARVPTVRGAARPLGIKLASPWDLLLHDNNLYIAMAGQHQIWRMTLDSGAIFPFAGNAAEDIIDGPLLARNPFQKGYASFAQPSGLASDGQVLFVADSEGSSIRAVPLRASRDVATILGTARLPADRLFTFGDRDGAANQVLLQHPLGVAYREGQLFIADTYNSKIKELDLKTATVRTLAGSGPNSFDEPGGLSIAGDQLFVADTNNHSVRVIGVAADAQPRELELKGLGPPVLAKVVSPPAVSGKPRTFEAATIKPTEDKLKVAINLALPADFKLNPGAPVRYYVHAAEENPVVAPAATGKWLTLEATASDFELELPLQAKATGGPVMISLAFYYCRSGAEGVCKAGEVTWSGRIAISDRAEDTRLELKHVVLK
ncbi:Thiol-disulfide oxidoreductase ResA [Anatilimnocola aggregata]|uniref:Thiol-disulfide oxidoreductase ResA n=1 Tax=Anatilimnocola aggregata TaxID=2528021 RepID=A0A517YDM1_9BACT|nr:thioredoxin-like domain-containing protein [Anatilimnocola aggregata]QDU28289.1 Thiol-disulfide oxidoreductase ResA [Anatilimnocola aggregata]